MLTSQQYIEKIINILDVIDVELVDAIVAEMHAWIPEILSVFIVFHSGQTDKAFFVDIDEQGIK